jgi:hypothetical protein
MTFRRFSWLLLVCAVLSLPQTQAQSRPRLADFFTDITSAVIDSSYTALSMFQPVTHDLDGDGHQDLIVLGANYPSSGVVNSPQPSRVYLGDGNGRFTTAPAERFPVNTLNTVHVRKVIFADLNGDSRSDMFVSAHGWDTSPFPGEQNRLYLSQANGGWRDSTANLPQHLDYSHTSAIGDVSGRGIQDIFVGNGYSGGTRIQPYLLLNSGSGQFTMTRTPIPAEANQLLDPNTSHHFAGANFGDLNGDGLPELMISADSSNAHNKLRKSLVLWNRDGQFSASDVTELPASAVFPNTHNDYDIRRADLNRDGLQDIIVIGRQHLNFGGWFVQLLINAGDKTFVDQTADRIPAGEFSSGSEGVATTAPWPLWINPIDFNGDGAPDFSIEFVTGSTPMLASQPLIWLNDGSGRFSTLKASDFVTPGNEWRLGYAHLVPTRNGFSFVTPQLYSGSGGLRITGLLATRPFTGR